MNLFSFIVICKTASSCFCFWFVFWVKKTNWCLNSARGLSYENHGNLATSWPWALWSGIFNSRTFYRFWQLYHPWMQKGEPFLDECTHLGLCMIIFKAATISCLSYPPITVVYVPGCKGNSKINIKKKAEPRHCLDLGFCSEKLSFVRCPSFLSLWLW